MTIEMTRRGLFARAGAAAVLGPLAVASAITTAHASDEEIDAFFNAGFDTCQADKLAQYWNMDLVEAKATAGAKILRGDKKYLKQAIRKAAKRYNCTVGFNYRDSDTLAEFWKHA